MAQWIDALREAVAEVVRALSTTNWRATAQFTAEAERILRQRAAQARRQVAEQQPAYAAAAA
ncbi:hypothetical protein OG871_39510 (plasmid) [Kitasatospora sp. NBC_00374]|uniref:hypothetical protein n=1 Tax=Kitasatospora sp. NBC_00374 TaxID=2975964 RepID=UPI002F913BCC